MSITTTQKSAIYQCFQCVNIETENSIATYMEDIFYLVLWGIEKKHLCYVDTYINFVHIHFNYLIVFKL